ncbi:MAG: HipA domain-containing protein, partial [Paludibacter sp.]
CIDYLSIFQLCQKLTRNMQEMWKLYRLMVFNYLIDNKDDHAKNFAFIVRDGEWYLAPAFDILASDGINGYHTTSINDSITPTKQDLITVAEKAGLETKKAIEVYDEMNSLVNKKLL